MRYLVLLSLSLAMFSVAAPAQADDDELVRLPGQGELRNRVDRDRFRADRLKPGAGLFISFDANADGRVTPDEITAGIPLAFAMADANSDGYLTALEQRDWANSLPTRDDSLANPVRFDPNLDRRVDLSEFTSVISGLSVDYADEETGHVLVASLKAGRRDRGEEEERPDALERIADPFGRQRSGRS